MSKPSIHRRSFLQIAAAVASTSHTPAFSTASDAGSITDVPGLRVGHYTDTRRPTGCTVLLFENGATAGVDVRGSAPGTRETDLLNPTNTVQQVNAILLSGGSAFGLDAASGVMRYLLEKGQGFHVGAAVVPIVPAAVLIDLNLGDPKIWPTAEAGYAACVAASNGRVAEGNVGAGAGATVGKLFGSQWAMKAGLGTASIRVGQTGIVVGALAAVNAVGDVVDGTGTIMAGARKADGQGFRGSMDEIKRGYMAKPLEGANTTLGMIATNARFTKTEVTKVAQMAQDGLARSINPVHTPYDGDTVFCVSAGPDRVAAQVSAVGAIAADLLSQAIRRAVMTATGIPGYPAWQDLQKK